MGRASRQPPTKLPDGEPVRLSFDNKGRLVWPASLTVSTRQVNTVFCEDVRRAAELTRYVSVHPGTRC